MTTIANRYEFLYLFDCENGNPNGDPDAGNAPRIDPEDMHGMVSDVALKRRVRNFVQVAKGNADGYAIFVEHATNMNRPIALAHEKTNGGIPEKATKDKVKKARDWMCANFYDIRTFGAVMTTDVNAGQVRGPVQLKFGRSVDPIFTGEHTITRMAVTTDAEAKTQQGDNRTMGRKFTVPYGLYRVHGFVNPHLAEKTGFGAEDLELFWKALEQMFEADRSAARGEMAPQVLVVFEHESPLGNAPASKLFDRVTVQRRDDLGDAPPRSFGDYRVGVDDSDLPAGVTINRSF